MTIINMDTLRLTDQEKKSKEYFHNLQPQGDSKDVYEVICNYGKTRFNMAKPTFDPKGAIDGFWSEEYLRCNYFYPFMKKDLYFYDIGAAHGSWTIPAIVLGANVVAFEPDPRYHETMRNSLKLNSFLDGSLRLYMLGMYSCNGVGSFFEVEDVRFTTIDDFNRRHKTAPSYMKIDVEGTESKVLRGAKKTIDLYKPYIFVEIHYGNKPEEMYEKMETDVIDFMTELDYQTKIVEKQKYISYVFFTYPN